MTYTCMCNLCTCTYITKYIWNVDCKNDYYINAVSLTSYIIWTLRAANIWFSPYLYNPLRLYVKINFLYLMVYDTSVQTLILHMPVYIKIIQWYGFDLWGHIMWVWGKWEEWSVEEVRVGVREEMGILLHECLMCISKQYNKCFSLCASTVCPSYINEWITWHSSGYMYFN